MLHDRPYTAAQAEARSAAITLADITLAVTCWDQDAEESGAWDKEAAEAMLTEALQTLDLAPYESVRRPPHRGIKKLGSNYIPPGRPSP